MSPKSPGCDLKSLKIAVFLPLTFIPTVKPEWGVSGLANSYGPRNSGSCPGLGRVAQSGDPFPRGDPWKLGVSSTNMFYIFLVTRRNRSRGHCQAASIRLNVRCTSDVNCN